MIILSNKIITRLLNSRMSKAVLSVAMKLRKSPIIDQRVFWYFCGPVQNRTGIQGFGDPYTIRCTTGPWGSKITSKYLGIGIMRARPAIFSVYVVLFPSGRDWRAAHIAKRLLFQRVSPHSHNATKML